MMAVRKPVQVPLRDRLQNWLTAQQDRPAAPNLYWPLVMLLGLAVLALAVHLETVFPAAGHTMSTGYGAPVIAFEFASNMGDLERIFGPLDDPLRSARLAAMQRGNELDYLFALAYALFLSLGCWCLWRESRRPIVLIGTVMPVMAAMFDGMENWLLFTIQAQFAVGEYSPHLASLWLPVMAKFLLLAATNLVIGHTLTQLGKPVLVIVGTLVLVPLVTVVMALIAPMAFGWTLGAALGAGWMALFGVAVAASWQAIVKRAPLVDFGTSPKSRPGRPAAAAPPPSPPVVPIAEPISPTSFGRRRQQSEKDQP